MSEIIIHLAYFSRVFVDFCMSRIILPLRLNRETEARAYLSDKKILVETRLSTRVAIGIESSLARPLSIYRRVPRKIGVVPNFVLFAIGLFQVNDGSWLLFACYSRCSGPCAQGRSSSRLFSIGFSPNRLSPGNNAASNEDEAAAGPRSIYRMIQSSPRGSECSG